MCAGYLVTLTAKLPHFVWIGLNDMKRRNYFEWQDNSEVDFTHWGPQQPDENVHSSNPDDRVGSWHTEKRYRKCQTTLLALEFQKLTSFFHPAFLFIGCPLIHSRIQYKLTSLCYCLYSTVAGY